MVFFFPQEMVESGACGVTQESGTAGNVSIPDSAVSGGAAQGVRPVDAELSLLRAAP